MTSDKQEYQKHPHIQREGLVLYDYPELNAPLLIVGFGGWPDAAGVALGSVVHLKNKLAAQKIGVIEADNFYDFVSTRHTIDIKDGIVKDLKLLSTEFYACKNKDADHDLLLLIGTEPHLKWNQYVNTVLDVAEAFGVKRIYGIGGTLDRVPHTREARVKAMVNDPALREELRRHDIIPLNYNGPTSILTVLALAAKKRGIEAICLWGQAPYYISVPNPAVSYSVLKHLSPMLGIDINLRDLRGAADYMEEQVNKVMTKNPGLQEHIRKLEEAYEAKDIIEPLESSEEIIQEVERFLQGNSSDDT